MIRQDYDITSSLRRGALHPLLSCLTSESFLLGTVIAMGSCTIFIGSCSEALKRLIPIITEKLTWISSMVAIVLGLGIIQIKKLVNTSRLKKLEKSHDLLALVAHTGSSSKNTSSYYVTHPTFVVDYDDEYQQDDIQTNYEDPLTSAMLLLARAITQNFSNPTNNRLRTSSNTRNQADIQGDRDSLEFIFGKYFNCSMLLAKHDEAGVILTDEQNDFLFVDASRMEEIKEPSANICLMDRIQAINHSFDVRPSYDSAFVSELQSSSINENEEKMYLTYTKIINSTIGDDQIDSNIIFDTPNGNVNNGSVEKDTQVPDLCALEQLARNAYQEARKQQIFAQKVQKQNKTLTSQLELYKERVRVLENINKDNNYLNEFLEANQRAKYFDQQAQSQFIRDRDIIRDVEKQRDKLELTSRAKQTWVNSNKNVIAPGMYKVVTPQETQDAKSGLSSTGMNVASSVRRSMNRDSHDKNSVLANSKNSAKKVAVYVKKNKQTDNTFANVISNNENVINVDVANASKIKNLLCVSCMQNVLILCHDKCLAHHRLNASRTLTTKSRTPKSSDTTYVVLKTRFSGKSAQSKTLDTTFVVSKSKIDVVQIVLWIVDSGCSKHMTGDRSLLRNFIEKFIGIVRFGNNNFTAIIGYGDYIQGYITICHVYYVEGLGHNLFSAGQFCDGVLEVAFRSKTCYVLNLEEDDLLTEGRESNLYTISIFDMAASSPVCLMSKATSTKSWLWHRRLSHLNFGIINDLTRLDLVNGLPKFKYEKYHFVLPVKEAKARKPPIHPNWFQEITPDWNDFIWINADQ
uniref:Uncharacterized protein n=1 Tax=Tanacetum cinerariifolium TaxID=118510 RepID=A0A6L2N5N0_TANCI|nr:hypothetical protein [Tanacetum cinerariifolium]